MYTHTHNLGGKCLLKLHFTIANCLSVKVSESAYFFHPSPKCLIVFDIVNNHCVC